MNTKRISLGGMGFSAFLILLGLFFVFGPSKEKTIAWSRAELEHQQTLKKDLSLVHTSVLTRLEKDRPILLAKYLDPLGSDFAASGKALDGVEARWAEVSELLPTDATSSAAGDPDAAVAILKEVSTVLEKVRTDDQGYSAQLDHLEYAAREASKAFAAANVQILDDARRLQQIVVQGGYQVALAGAQRDAASAAALLASAAQALQQPVSGLYDLPFVYESATSAKETSARAVAQAEKFLAYAQEWPRVRDQAAQAIERERGFINSYGSYSLSARNSFGNSETYLANAKRQAVNQQYEQAVQGAHTAIDTVYGLGNVAYAAYQAYLDEQRQEQERSVASHKSPSYDSDWSDNSSSDNSDSYSSPSSSDDGGGFDSGGSSDDGGGWSDSGSADDGGAW